jgi:hypothetical protein
MWAAALCTPEGESVYASSRLQQTFAGVIVTRVVLDNLSSLSVCK